VPVLLLAVDAKFPIAWGVILHFDSPHEKNTPKKPFYYQQLVHLTLFGRRYPDFGM